MASRIYNRVTNNGLINPKVPYYGSPGYMDNDYPGTSGYWGFGYDGFDFYVPVNSSFTNEIAASSVVCTLCGCQVDDDGNCCCSVHVCACDECHETITCNEPCPYCSGPDLFDGYDPFDDYDPFDNYDPWGDQEEDDPDYDSGTETDGTPEGQGGRPDLGYIGNEIRDRAGSDFSKSLFENYWTGRGDMTLTADRFNDIANAAKGLPQEYYFVTLSNGNPGVKAITNFYSNAEYSLAFGRATLYYDQRGQVVGFSDYYDFDPKAWGVRPTSAEIMTRIVNAAGALYGAKPFYITYGIGVDF